MNGPGVLLRVFSGAHLGAELPLPPGEWVIGTDDSCDLVLRDTAMRGRHAALTARDGDEAGLDCVPLDGPVSMDGGERAPGPLPPETLFTVGGTLFAWVPLARADSAPGIWRRLEAELRVRERGEPGTPATFPEADPDSGVGTLSTGVGAPAVPHVGDRLPESAGAPAERPVRRFVRPALLLAALALGGLLFSVRGGGDVNAERVGDLNALFVREGFPALTARADPDPLRRGVTVSGDLQDDAERGRLLNLVQGLRYPVYLDVRVRTDRTAAIERGFGIRGLSLQARESADGGKRLLRVSGYARDGGIEDWAFSGVREDLPTLLPDPDSGEVARRIVHAGDVERVLAPALAREGLDHARIAYLPGKVELSGVFTFEQRRRLAPLLAGVQRELNVPVPIEVRTAPPRVAAGKAPVPQGRRPARNEDSASGPPAGPDAGPDGFGVVGVTLKPLPFVSLKNGERIFEGGVLPGGWILESIGVNELKLVRDGQSRRYQLRGNS